MQGCASNTDLARTRSGVYENPGNMPMQSLHEPPEGRSVEIASFKAAMRTLASGVCIVATGAGKGKRGLTVTAVCSLTMEPPRVLVCVNKSADGHDHILRNGVFSLSVLASEHRRLAEVFSGQDGSKGSVRFEADRWRMSEHEAPVLADALCGLVCEVTETLDMGSHTVVIGLVVDAAYRQEGEALLYHQAKFAVPAPIEAGH